MLLNYCLLFSKYEASYLYNSPIKLIILAGGNCKHLHFYFLNIAQISQNKHLENQERQNLKFSLVLDRYKSVDYVKNFAPDFIYFHLTYFIKTWND